MNLLFILLISSGIILVILMLRRLSLGKILLSVMSGLSALFCCDLIMSLFSPCGMPLNPYTLTISALGGIPGVILLVLLKMLL
ncbi:MAG: pro-sigmaK processing inhibitor BofA family protein [Clostridia bacterium]|nr:pro-sigmaK processing inhibitor BofA family protein [Clostridia bacterium]